MEEFVTGMSDCLVALAAITGSDIVFDVGVHLWPEDVPSDDLYRVVHAHVPCYCRIMLGLDDFAFKVLVAATALRDPESFLVVKHAMFVGDILAEVDFHGSDIFFLPHCISGYCQDHAFWKLRVECDHWRC